MANLFKSEYKKTAKHGYLKLDADANDEFLISCTISWFYLDLHLNISWKVLFVGRFRTYSEIIFHENNKLILHK
jgi:hypothetical protein